MRRARILYVHHGQGIGGAPLSLLYLIQQLDQARYEPVVACLHDSAAADLYRKAGISTVAGLGVTSTRHSALTWYRWYQPYGMLQALWSLVKTLRVVAPRLYREVAPDLVHLNTSGLVGWAVAAKRLGLPVVCHVREPLAAGYFGLRSALLRRLIHRCADAVIPICRYDATTLTPSPRVHVVYNFVNFRQFDRARRADHLRPELGLPEGASVVLYLGGMDRVKGVLELLQGAEAFLADGTCLVVTGYMWATPLGVKGRVLAALRRVGVPLYRLRVEAQIRRLRATYGPAAVTLVGVRDDVPSLIALADVLVFPATVPHFARPVIEAAAMGKPSVASNFPGIAELIDDGVTGVLVEPGQPVPLGSAVRALLRQPELRAAMGDQAYRKARQEFDAATNSAQVFKLYAALLDGHRT